MKLIIAGSRTISVGIIELASIISILKIPRIKTVVCGTAKGVDTSGEEYALALDIQIESFPADWDKYGKPAGHIRNKEMADFADALLIIWDGKSDGSRNMKKEMTKLKKPIYEVILNSYNIPKKKKENGKEFKI